MTLLYYLPHLAPQTLGVYAIGAGCIAWALVALVSTSLDALRRSGRRK